jgi:anaerobic C4-dicarboxylate transporter
VKAIAFYADRGALVLAVAAAYLLFALTVFQLVLLALAVREPERPLSAVAVSAGGIVVARPVQAVVLGLALALVNLAGIAAAIMPFLTVTIAYTFLAAAHFALPPTSEARD